MSFLKSSDIIFKLDDIVTDPKVTLDSGSTVDVLVRATTPMN